MWLLSISIHNKQSSLYLIILNLRGVPLDITTQNEQKYSCFTNVACYEITRAEHYAGVHTILPAGPFAPHTITIYQTNNNPPSF